MYDCYGYKPRPAVRIIMQHGAPLPSEANPSDWALLFTCDSILPDMAERIRQFGYDLYRSELDKSEIDGLKR